jgi:hypothetical protein
VCELSFDGSTQPGCRSTALCKTWNYYLIYQAKIAWCRRGVAPSLAPTSGPEDKHTHREAFAEHTTPTTDGPSAPQPSALSAPVAAAMRAPHCSVSSSRHTTDPRNKHAPEWQSVVPVSVSDLNVKKASPGAALP